jgi:hypothetical protein
MDPLDRDRTREALHAERTAGEHLSHAAPPDESLDDVLAVELLRHIGS